MANGVRYRMWVSIWTGGAGGSRYDTRTKKNVQYFTPLTAQAIANFKRTAPADLTKQVRQIMVSKFGFVQVAPLDIIFVIKKLTNGQPWKIECGAWVWVDLKGTKEQGLRWLVKNIPLDPSDFQFVKSVNV